MYITILRPFICTIIIYKIKDLVSFLISCWSEVPWYHNKFYPRPVLAFGYCRYLSVCPSIRPCVNHELVRAITHHPFKLGSPNLDHICKRPWLRSLSWRWLTLTFKVKFNFKVKIYLGYPGISVSLKRVTDGIPRVCFTSLTSFVDKRMLIQQAVSEGSWTGLGDSGIVWPCRSCIN